MEMKHIYKLFTACLCLLTACYGKHVPEPPMSALSRAEVLVWEYPDSALALLGTLDISEKEEYRYALRNLLHTQAQSLKKRPFTSDSTIQAALRYFGNEKDTYRKAMAWFYAGQVYADLRRPVEAVDAYIRAKEYAAETADHRLQYHICLNHGWLCLNQGALDEARTLFDTARLHAEYTENDKYKILSLNHIGRYYAFKAEYDSAAFQMEEALNIARRIDDPKSLDHILNDIAIVYDRQGRYTLAIRYLNESIAISEREGYDVPYSSYHNLGDIYRMMEMPDSSVYYFDKALETKDIGLLQSCYFSLWHLYEGNSYLEDALHFNKLFWFYTDSIEKTTHYKEVVDLHTRTAAQQLQVTNQQLQMSADRIERVMWIGLIMALLLFSLLIYYYQRKLFRQELLLQAEKRQLEKREQEHQQASLQAMQEELLRENQELDNHLDQLKQKETDRITYSRMVEQNQMLHSKINRLVRELFKRIKFISSLKSAPKRLTKEEERAIKMETNRIFSGFIDELPKQYPVLTDDDIVICCLIKLEFSTSTISEMMGISPGSITKRKRRIKEKMRNCQPDLWENDPSLDAFLKGLG